MTLVQEFQIIMNLRLLVKNVFLELLYCVSGGDDDDDDQQVAFGIPDLQSEVNFGADDGFDMIATQGVQSSGNVNISHVNSSLCDIKMLGKSSF